VVAGVVAVVGFVLLLLVVNTYGNLGGNRLGDLLVSILFALVISGVFSIGLLCLSIGSTSMRQEHVAWHNQPVFLQGIGIILAALTLLMIVVSLSHLLPHLLAVALGILCATLGLVCALWSVGVSQAHRRN